MHFFGKFFCLRSTPEAIYLSSSNGQTHGRVSNDIYLLSWRVRIKWWAARMIGTSLKTIPNSSLLEEWQSERGLYLLHFAQWWIWWDRKRKGMSKTYGSIRCRSIQALKATCQLSCHHLELPDGLKLQDWHVVSQCGENGSENFLSLCCPLISPDEEIICVIHFTCHCL